MKYNVKFKDYGFFKNLYLSIVFSYYKIEDKRNSKDITIITNTNIDIQHNLFWRCKIILNDK